MYILQSENLATVVARDPEWKYCMIVQLVPSWVATKHRRKALQV